MEVPFRLLFFYDCVASFLIHTFNPVIQLEGPISLNIVPTFLGKTPQQTGQCEEHKNPVTLHSGTWPRNKQVKGLEWISDLVGSALKRSALDETIPNCESAEALLERRGVGKDDYRQSRPPKSKIPQATQGFPPQQSADFFIFFAHVTIKCPPIPPDTKRLP